MTLKEQVATANEIADLSANVAQYLAEAVRLWLLPGKQAAAIAAERDASSDLKRLQILVGSRRARHRYYDVQETIPGSGNCLLASDGCQG